MSFDKSSEEKTWESCKKIIKNINKNVREKLKYNQWRNTSNVIDWFQNIVEKNNIILIQSDIKEFYPSITKHLMLKAIELAKFYTSITQHQVDKTLGKKQLLNHYMIYQWKV